VVVKSDYQTLLCSFCMKTSDGSLSSYDITLLSFTGYEEISGSFQMQTSRLSGVRQQGEWSRTQTSRLPAVRTCLVCGKTFWRRDRFEEHMNMHNKIKAFQCQNCRRKFTHRRNLDHHLKLGVCSKFTHETF
jgi:hypothetical protein